MARTPRALSTTDIYHVIIKGTGKQILFESHTDGAFFMRVLKKYAGEEGITIYGYCLMDNHVHLLLHGLQPSLSLFMKRLCGHYALYFNEKYERTGTLFQSRFRSEAVENERYFLTVLRYIIMNPERAGLCQRDCYKWSCYLEYAGNASVCDTSFAARIAAGSEDLMRFLNSDPDDVREKKGIHKVSDDDAKELMRNLLNVSSGVQLQSFERKERDEALRLLKSNGITIRQIERLTGINRGAVQRA